MESSGAAEYDPLVGRTIDDRYRVVSRLGAGGMGYVYLAEHVQLGHTLVLKRLRPELVESDSTRERFLREAQAASKIQHPHVIAVSDFGVLAEFGAYYAMELLVGSDLGDELRRTGAMSVPRALAIAEQATEALAAAHAAAIVHRDMKPENIYLTVRDGQPDFVKVLDFGLARVMDANRKLTETGQVIGTPRYMAPEQCRGEKVDARADVYSMALILHEMLTGVQPYVGMSTYEILGKKMFEHIAAPSALLPPVDLPPPLEAFLMRCLSREAPLRPKNGAAMADGLHAVRSELGLPPNAFAHLAEGARQSMPSVSVSVDGSDSIDRPAPQSSIPAAATSIPAGSASFSPSAAPPYSPSAAPPPKSGGGGLALALGVAAGLAGIAVVGVGLAWFLLGRTSVPAPPEPPAVVAVRVTEPAAEPTAAEPVATPPPAPPRTSVAVVSEPPGAEVLFDDVLLGTTPLSLDVPGAIPSGSHVVIRLDGYAARRIVLTAGVPTAHVRLHESDEDGP